MGRSAKLSLLPIAFLLALGSGPAGFPDRLDPAAAAECEGDECQGPPPAPEEIVPATAIVEGPPDPAVRFPKPRHSKKHHSKKPKRHSGKRAGR